MKKLAFRDLRPEEIEVRVGNIIKDQNGSPKSFNLLLYKTSRTDMAILDETFGTFGWRNHFYQVKNTMVCSIEVYDEETKQWINKDNGGDDDYTIEQIKSELSDSIKRAGSTLGIGRKLYTANKIYMVVDITKDNTTKGYYQVKEIEYDETSITKLVVINKKTKEVVINYPKSFVAKTTENAPKNANKGYIDPKEIKVADTFSHFSQEKGSITDEQKAMINTYISGLTTVSHDRFFVKLDNTYGVGSIDFLSEHQANEIISKISK